MKCITVIIFVLLFSQSSYGQDLQLDPTLSIQDSTLLNNFWTDLSTAVKKNDKEKLATLCDFPFYCSPCIDDSTIKKNNHLTIKVTKKLFFATVYREFFDKPIRNEVESHPQFEAYIFHTAYDDKNRRNGFMFSYTIIKPSKKFEGMQGFIYLNKKNGKYKITGIDTVP